MEEIVMAANRILIAEDDKGFADGIAVNLGYVGYEYMSFENGRTAAEHLEEDHSFDLALLDIMLPGIDRCPWAVLICGKIQYLCIYMMTKTDYASEIKGLRDDAEDYLVKPLT